jgi:CheY-specific phosphatase CheX
MPYDTQALAATTCNVIEDILETMFFSTAVAVECCHLPGAISARVRFDGEASGEFELLLTRGVARQYASAFLGVEESDLPSSAEAEVSCELANMICGAALSRVHPDSVVRLHAPRIGDPAARLDGVHQCFETPEGVLSITMRVN